MKTFYPPMPSLCGALIWSTLHIHLLTTLALEAPSGSGSWVWENGHSELDNIRFEYYFLHLDTCDELVLCVFQCLQIRECQSFTVETVEVSRYKCRFHSRRFSSIESSYLGSPAQGLEYFAISSNCPTSDSHFFSREASMCVSVNVITRTKDQARDYCADLGGDLVVIDTKAKEVFIADVLSQYSSWSTKYFHTDAEDVPTAFQYQWPDKTPVSTDIMGSLSYYTLLTLGQCVKVIYRGTGDLLGKPYNCNSEPVRTICEYPI